MRQAMKQLFGVIQVISFGLVTALLPFFQSIPSVSAQQLTRSVSQETDGTGTHSRRSENIAPTLRFPTKSMETKDTPTFTNKPHRLIRKPQNAPVASIEPSHSGSSPITPIPTAPLPLQEDNTAAQSKESSSFNRSLGAAVPLATVSVAPPPATATRSTSASTTSNTATPLAAAGGNGSSISENRNTGGRSMSRLAADMPGLAQLVSPTPPQSVPTNPVIGASPTSLSFTAQQGGTNPTAQMLSISNTGGTLNWSASETTGWLMLSPASGSGNGTVTVSVTTGTLTAGSYSGTVILNATGASSVAVPVMFTVTAAPVPPAIGASPTNFSFTAAQGGSNPANQTLSISNTGGGTLTWSASENAPWLTIGPASGSGNGAVTLSVATGTLATGSHSGTVTMSATGATPVTVPVTFTVTAAPAIGTSPTNFSFTATQGGSNPANQTLSISNTGGGTLTWSASENAPWLTIGPASGTGNGAVTLSVATGTLATGSHSGTVTMSASGATPVTVPVTFTVTAVPNITLNPASLSYTATQGAANPANKTISLTSTGGSLNWTVNDNASWLTVSPGSGSNNSTLTTSVNTAGLAAGSHTGTITVSAAGFPSKTVAVTLTVSAPTTSSAALAWNANAESDLAGYKIYRATASGGYGAPIATLQGNVTNYVAAGLQSGTTYFFVITAYDSTGNESVRSNEVSKSIF